MKANRNDVISPSSSFKVKLFLAGELVVERLMIIVEVKCCVIGDGERDGVSEEG